MTEAKEDAVEDLDPEDEEWDEDDIDEGESSGRKRKMSGGHGGASGPGKKPKLKGKGGSSCHQCKSRRNFTHLTYCTSNLDKKNKKCRKKFCGHCLKKFYEEGPACIRDKNNWKCPSCRKICCCAACRRRKQKDGHPDRGGNKKKRSARDYDEEEDDDDDYDPTPAPSRKTSAPSRTSQGNHGVSPGDDDDDDDDEAPNEKFPKKASQFNEGMDDEDQNEDENDPGDPSNQNNDGDAEFDGGFDDDQPSSSLPAVPASARGSNGGVRGGRSPNTAAPRKLSGGAVTSSPAGVAVLYKDVQVPPMPSVVMPTSGISSPMTTPLFGPSQFDIMPDPLQLEDDDDRPRIPASRYPQHLQEQLKKQAQEAKYKRNSQFARLYNVAQQPKIKKKIQVILAKKDISHSQKVDCIASLLRMQHERQLSQAASMTKTEKPSDPTQLPKTESDPDIEHPKNSL